MFLPEKAEESYNVFSRAAFADGPLDAKTKQLVALAASYMADCVPCIQHHYKEAVAAGAAPEEINEVNAIVVSVAGGSKRAKYNSILPVLAPGKANAE